MQISDGARGFCMFIKFTEYFVCILYTAFTSSIDHNISFSLFFPCKLVCYLQLGRSTVNNYNDKDVKNVVSD